MCQSRAEGRFTRRLVGRLERLGPRNLSAKLGGRTTAFSSFCAELNTADTIKSATSLTNRLCQDCWTHVIIDLFVQVDAALGVLLSFRVRVGRRAEIFLLGARSSPLASPSAAPSTAATTATRLGSAPPARGVGSAARRRAGRTVVDAGNFARAAAGPLGRDGRAVLVELLEGRHGLRSRVDGDAGRGRECRLLSGSLQDRGIVASLGRRRVCLSQVGDPNKRSGARSQSLVRPSLGRAADAHRCRPRARWGCPSSLPRTGASRSRGRRPAAVRLQVAARAPTAPAAAAAAAAAPAPAARTCSRLRLCSSQSTRLCIPPRVSALWLDGDFGVSRYSGRNNFPSSRG